MLHSFLNQTFQKFFLFPLKINSDLLQIEIPHKSCFTMKPVSLNPHGFLLFVLWKIIPKTRIMEEKLSRKENFCTKKKASPGQNFVTIFKAYHFLYRRNILQYNFFFYCFPIIKMKDDSK